jgi:hypothetical protein
VKSIFNFIIKPKVNRYDNIKKIDNKELILNTEIFSHQYVSRVGVVLETPTAYKTNIKVGDEVIVHHNVFRRWHNQNDEEKNSRNYFEEDKYFVYIDQIFAYKANNKWEALDGYCFVKPIEKIESSIIKNNEKERPLIGVLKYLNNNLKKTGLKQNDLVGFTPESEYEFVIEKEKLYRILTKDITIKYEYQGDEKEYNPSWA